MVGKGLWWTTTRNYWHWGFGQKQSQLGLVSEQLRGWLTLHASSQTEGPLRIWSGRRRGPRLGPDFEKAQRQKPANSCFRDSHPTVNLNPLRSNQPNWWSHLLSQEGKAKVGVGVEVGTRARPQVALQFKSSFGVARALALRRLVAGVWRLIGLERRECIDLGSWLPPDKQNIGFRC